QRLGLEVARAGNRQANARSARLAALVARATARGAREIALAHTADDQAETVLMRLARGSGVDGLAAMRPRRALPDGPALVRPLLGLSRGALRGWLRARGIGWIDDPSNRDPASDRIRARAALATLAPLGITRDGLAATAGRLSGQRAVLDAAADRLWAAAYRRGVAGELLLDAAALAGALPDTGLRVVARAHAALTGAPYPPRLQALETALAMARALAAGGQAGGQAEGQEGPQEGPQEGTEAGTEAGGRGETADRPLSGGVILAAAVAAGRPALALCREPAACAPPCPAGAGDVSWDGRLRLLAEAPAGSVLGALGPRRIDGLAARAARLDAEASAEAWRCAPRPARLSAPALTAPDGTLLAVHSGRFGWLTGPVPPPIAAPGAFQDLVARRLPPAAPAA
ncbi:MAG: tRNA lysidine(34) synthetase TilS, partial [Pseudomonadota bacterium]